jgi:hypothetical protein
MNIIRTLIVRPERKGFISGRQLLAIIALVVIVILGLKGWQLFTLVQALRQDVQSLERIMQTPASITNGALGPQLARFRAHAITLRSAAAPLFPITRQLGWVPTYGTDLAAAEPLLDLLANLGIAGDESFQALAPIIAEHTTTQPIGVMITQQLSSERPRLEMARQALAQAAADGMAIPVAQTTSSIRAPLERVLPLLPTASEGIDLAIALPELLGAQGPRSYLLLAQDVNEIRATGGFIGATGVLTLDSGRYGKPVFVDSYAIDNLAAHHYGAPPAPLGRYLGLTAWLFRDTNWSPDFPTSARAAMRLYQQGQGQKVDGVVTFDETAVQILLDAIGPVAVAGTDTPISSANVIAYMRNEYITHWNSQQTWKHRKDFVEPLGQAIMAQLESGASRMNLLALAHAAKRVLDERHVLVYLEQPAAAAILTRHSWDGAVQPGDHDFLMIVDSNVGYNKVYRYIREHMAYVVDISDPTAPLATLVVRQTHELSGSSDCPFHNRGPVSFEGYYLGCFWNYLRVLIPNDSHLVAAYAAPVPEESTFWGDGYDGTVSLGPGEASTNELGALVVVPSGGERETAFAYQLPPGVLTREGTAWRYRLKLQKQPGTDAIPYHISIRLPQGATLLSTSIPPAETVAGMVSFAFELTRDRSLEIAFRP